MAVLVFSLPKAWAQAPNSFNFQAVVRNQDAELVSESSVGLQISILSGGVSGDVVYSEIHRKVTSTFGSVSLQVGTGTIESGSFADIDWSAGPFFLQTAIDLNNGTSFEVISTTEMVSVPFALYANQSGDVVWQKNNSTAIYNAGNVGIGTDSPSAKLEITGDGTSNADVLTLRNSYSTALRLYGSGNEDFYNSSLILHRARGTDQAPSELVAGDRVGGMYASPFVGGEFINTSAVHMYVEEGISSTSFPTNIRFETTGKESISRQERMRITGDGNVGIGTDAPIETLSVNGTVESMVGGFKFPDGTVQSTAFTGNGSSTRWATGSTGIHYTGGRVGVGITTPTSKMEVMGEGSGNVNVLTLKNDHTAVFRVFAGSDSDNNNAVIFLGRSRGTTTNPTNLQSNDRVGSLYAQAYLGDAYRTTSGITMYLENGVSSASFATDLRFETTGQNEIRREERMRITGDGNVGIGTEEPEARLQVKSGDIYLEDVNSGVIMKSPNGACWRLSIDDEGGTTVEAITCPGE